MSTNDVPGYKEENRDELALGCWAEHEDGSLILVEGVEKGVVVYTMFDTSMDPIIEYRDRMAEGAFKEAFSWRPDLQPIAKGKKKKDIVPNIKWTWHDKTPFDWDRVIVGGLQGGMKYADSESLLSSAARVARHRELRGRKFDYDPNRISGVGKRIRDKIQRAITALRT
jgi:hypothetical protein